MGVRSSLESRRRRPECPFRRLDAPFSSSPSKLHTPPPGFAPLLRLDSPLSATPHEHQVGDFYRGFLLRRIYICLSGLTVTSSLLS